MYRMIRSDIYRNDEGELDIDYEQDTHGGITTQRGASKDRYNPGRPYKSADSLLNGHTVYSVYAFTGDDYVSIFKDIKKGRMDRKLYREWLVYTAEYIYSTVLRKDMPDIIAIPESSSNLVEDLAMTIRAMYNIKYLPFAFHKNPVSKITLEIPQNVKISKDALTSAQKVLDKIKSQGYFEAKLVPKRMLKFFRNIYTNEEDYIDLLEGKKVVVLDDSMTSRATMSNIFDVCDHIYNTAESYGVTIFKKTGSHRG